MSKSSQEMMVLTLEFECNNFEMNFELEKTVVVFEVMWIVD
jgi:hypothetical protein